MTTEQLKLNVTFRKPQKSDGAAIWSMVKKVGTLDINSSYAYFILADQFSDTCTVAEVDGKIAGFVTGFKPPQKPGTLFVWQIGVEKNYQGHGIAKRLLTQLMQHNPYCQKIHTTISPDNKASEALFRSFAKSFGYTVNTENYLEINDFPGEGHEEEILFILEKK